MLKRLDFRPRARAACIHLFISAAVAASGAALVFGLWYPGIYRLASGGRELFLILTGVDVVLGPLLTFAVFDIRKEWSYLRRDLVIIGLMQAAALTYGMSVVMAARPIAMVFEVDRFRVLNRDQIRLVELPNALPAYRELPLTGPWLLGTRKARNAAESEDALFAALGGVDLGQRPAFWQPYADSRSAALAKARPVSLLLANYPARSAEIRESLQSAGLKPESATFLPVMARGDWVAVLDKSGTPVTFLRLDGFF